ncbi:SAF domain-containing protein [Bacillus mesophilum]|uniref:SAF domain-containing protein n=1 Tax=Bacillus mesophilum TaxID=1071718 RepID=A0A7V7RHY0_9BACI|nr:SAF domain-containing protein [Bacillus mesophilum]KAB2329455.1 hypothetical protein F7732_21255 [Bacillus mesophilum]
MKVIFNKQFIISGLFFMLFVLAVVANQFDLLKGMTTTPVVMAKSTIEKDTIITEDHIWIHKMPKEMVQEGMFTHLDQVVGKTTTQIIYTNQYISTTSVDQSVLRPTAEHEFFPIPDSWLVEKQGTLRRYDLVNLAAITLEASEGINARPMTEYIFEQVPVAFIKNSRNEEVTGVTHDNDRLNGAQTPSKIELSLTLEQFKELESLYLEGYRFILSY